MTARVHATVLIATVLIAGLLATACASASTGPGSVDTYDAGLWAQRPVVDLAFDVAPDLRTATGHETVVFTPDLRACELLFRAWPNNPTMSATGSALVVTDVAVDGRPAQARVEQAGAPPGAPGTLIEIPLGACIEPGGSVRADLGFRLTLGVDADERVGTSSATGTAWFGSGFPLLAWVRSTGWARDPAVPMNGETATSEAFALHELAVTVPEDMAVAGVGSATGTTPGARPGTVTHRFTAPAVRDVTVGVGAYTILDKDVGDVHLHLATPTAGTRTDPQEWTARISDAIGKLTGIFGPFPFRDLWVTITPGQSDGTEYPGAVQFGDSRAQRALVAHELSHQWFYGLVGNNQAEDPWLDEGLATYGEVRVSGDEPKLDGDPAVVQQRVQRPMSWWAANGGYDAYTEGVYNQTAALLLTARARAGENAFDEALRGYIRAHAHGVATPGDLVEAFRGLPAAHEVLAGAGP